MRKSSRLLAFAGVLVFTVAVLASSAGASHHKHQKVYWIDLAGQASQHPERVYFTANSGGYMKDVNWRHWGKHKTIGRGTFGTTAPCNGSPCPAGPAKITMRKPVKCTPEFGNKKGKTVRVYRHAKLEYPDGQGNTETANITDRAGWASCKQAH